MRNRLQNHERFHKRRVADVARPKQELIRARRLQRRASIRIHEPTLQRHPELTKTLHLSLLHLHRTPNLIEIEASLVELQSQLIDFTATAKDLALSITDGRRLALREEASLREKLTMAFEILKLTITPLATFGEFATSRHQFSSSHLSLLARFGEFTTSRHHLSNSRLTLLARFGEFKTSRHNFSN